VNTDEKRRTKETLIYMVTHGNGIVIEAGKYLYEYS